MRCVDLDGISSTSATFNASACSPGAQHAGGACVMPCGDNGTWPQGLQGQCHPCLNFDCDACSPLDGTPTLALGLQSPRALAVALPEPEPEP